MGNKKKEKKKSEELQCRIKEEEEKKIAEQQPEEKKKLKTIHVCFQPVFINNLSNSNPFFFSTTITFSSSSCFIFLSVFYSFYLPLFLHL